MSFAARMRFDAREVTLEITVAAGETVAIVGPNGAGKSTLLNAIAGVIRPDSGRAELEGTVLFDLPGTDRRPLWLPPHRRAVSLLAQEALLFPHLSVLENVAFGPRSAGVPPRAARETARHWLREVDAEPLAQRRPAELSGGQAQRIAVARALASNPGLLLLDEPLAALDVAVAPAVRRMLRRVLATRSAVIITHDVLDAYTLADRVLVVEGGRVIDAGTPSGVFDRPRTPFAAQLAGVNLLTGIRSGEAFVTGDGVSIPWGDWPATPGGVPLCLAVRPSAVTVSLDKPALAAGLVLTPLIDLEPRGDIVRVRSALLAADVSPREAAALDAAIGAEVWFSFPTAAASVYATAR